MNSLKGISQNVLAAVERFSHCPTPPHRTLLERNNRLSELTGMQVFLKHEQMQLTGSFKYRGALNCILSLSSTERAAGALTASSGNHGMACAMAAKAASVPLTVYVPENASALKLKKIGSLGATIKKVAGDCLNAETEARMEATKQGKTYISPYNNHSVMAGQGTIGVELLTQLPELDAVFIAVGGGGLIGGVGALLKAKRPDIKVIGCWPSNSPAMARCLEAGQIIQVDESPTLSDGTAGNVEDNAITFEVCQQVIDEKVLVTENEIRNQMLDMLKNEQLVVEGAAGVALAGAIKYGSALKGKNVAIILCGRNIAYETLFSIIT
ncbi:threonine/serine dehydratase [Alteromonas sp. ASW11-130]|uniref:threonine/serine dehydratase n=1 Tax=Alteromonas sp. ASW11-130 TaxID=3015775 RepID=UPI002241BF4A|nr:threonine/serine dehydratase [Alteromonas sp. ASW11-130]MCW8090887.1 threonine/serine dehydratase [Alteromonas sp. ASW11-130]